MKTLAIGDLHLMGSLILPAVAIKVKELKIDRIVFMGDYVDQFGQTENLDLFISEMEYLVKFKKDMEKEGVDTCFLLGNHDVPYLLGSSRHYTLGKPKDIKRVGGLLRKLNPQISTTIGEYVASHGGYVGDWEQTALHQTPLMDKEKAVLKEAKRLEGIVGSARNGDNLYGSPLWCDFHKELSKMESEYHPLQIVGHTSVFRICTESNFIGVDSFSIKPNRREIGKGEILIVDGKELSVIEICDWYSPESYEKRIEHFK